SDKRDSNWVYVPALRRVRAVSPANRSDGFLGSDMSQDDGPFFDGKPADFTWKLIGQKDMLRIVDPLSLQGKTVSVWLPGGGGPGGREVGGGSEEARLPRSELERLRLGADRGRAVEASDVGHRRNAQGQVLPVRQDRALHRQGELPGRVEPQVQLERRVAEY